MALDRNFAEAFSAACAAQDESSTAAIPESKTRFITISMAVPPSGKPKRPGMFLYFGRAAATAHRLASAFGRWPRAARRAPITTTSHTRLLEHCVSGARDGGRVLRLGHSAVRERRPQATTRASLSAYSACLLYPSDAA